MANIKPKEPIQSYRIGESDPPYKPSTATEWMISLFPWKFKPEELRDSEA